MHRQAIWMLPSSTAASNKLYAHMNDFGTSRLQRYSCLRHSMAQRIHIRLLHLYNHFSQALEDTGRSCTPSSNPAAAALGESHQKWAMSGLSSLMHLGLRHEQRQDEGHHPHHRQGQEGYSKTQAVGQNASQL